MAETEQGLIRHEPVAEGEVLEPGTMEHEQTEHAIRRMGELLTWHQENLEREVLGMPPLPKPPA